MLKQFSRLEKTRSLIIIIFAVLMGISLVFFYAPNRNANATPTRSNEAVAKVNGDEITVSDLSVLKEAYSQMFGGQFNIAQLGGDRRLLDGLIRDRIVTHEAARLGLAPSDAEVADAIRKRYTDPATGKFVGFDRYKELVVAQFGDIERYERQTRDTVAARKLRAFITAGVNVSPKEVEEDYQRKNTSFDLVYVPIMADQLAKSINPSDEDLQNYYNSHKDEFRINVAQKKIRYLYIDQAKMGERVQISDEELRTAFNELKPENKQAGVRVQQIVLRVARPELDQQVLQKASELVARMRDEKTLEVTEEEFAEAARGNSEDPATAKNGGWLPGLVRRNPNKPNDLLQSTLDMKVGQVNDPMKTGNAYYIFRRGDAVEKTFEEAKRELVVSRRNSRGYAAAAELAARAAARLKETKDFQKVAAEFAPQASMSAGEMVRETPFVKPQDDVPGIGSSPQFEQAIAPLENAGDIGDRVSIKGGFAVPSLVEKRDPRVPDFAEVRENVVGRVRQERAQAQLEQAARDLAANANSPDELKAAAERLGLKAEAMPAYKLGTPLGQAGTTPALDQAINNLKAGEITKTPVKSADTWVVVGATKRTEADLAEFAKLREQLTQTTLDSRRNQVFEDYVTATRARYDREGDIKIYDEVLDRLAKEETPAAAPPVGLPVPPAG
ncbi:MAG TPA: peptidyl-prolyl cis-trans isomerase [Pyrinomonadaceae bacterium]|jgi:peptidyl-prolyl cis-trans isomerase D